MEACIRLGVASLTPTSLPCAWNQVFSEKVQTCFKCITKLNVALYHVLPQLVASDLIIQDAYGQQMPEHNLKPVHLHLW